MILFEDEVFVKASTNYFFEKIEKIVDKDY
jgi:hypothetical protein